MYWCLSQCQVISASFFAFLFSLIQISDTDLPFRHIHHMCLSLSVSFWSIHGTLDNLHAVRSFLLDWIPGAEFSCLDFLTDRLYRRLWLPDTGITGYEWSCSRNFSKKVGNMERITSGCDFSTGGKDRNTMWEVKHFICNRLRESVMPFSSINFMISKIKSYCWYKKNKLLPMCFSQLWNYHW